MLVELPDGDVRRLAELRKGDLVMTSNDGAPAKVVCLVRTRCPGGKMLLVELPGRGFKLTPYHPVNVKGEWCFPIDFADPYEHRCDAVYGIVLRGGPSVLIGGVSCVAYGHGIQQGAAAHPYYATESVVKDLQKFPGFEKGLVELDARDVVRDPQTKLVCGLKTQYNHRSVFAENM
eukprot:gnl/MRDRNA2_/MRDRNA2_18962_c0_seq1.p1 gnl/MRDRNA2_/MRDRNA2_18962_c0~~gnl/MRDRNA2_/MRDRNA2_18962_c0_seq1.p1  ORF type:complete len:176 (-),score=20.34 gnl/MRDRNA2_/MRDRNA2_18962_c0_seq1:14-541(-)